MLSIKWDAVLDVSQNPLNCCKSRKMLTVSFTGRMGQNSPETGTGCSLEPWLEVYN